MENKIKEVISKVLKTEVNDSTSQDNCSEWDSLKHLNLIIELEHEFDISIEPDEIAQMKNITSIIKIIFEKTNGLH